jgi:uncharacterized protein YfaA (DUF2138 family)
MGYSGLHFMQLKILHDVLSFQQVNIFTKEESRFGLIGSLTRLMTEVVYNLGEGISRK